VTCEHDAWPAQVYYVYGFMLLVFIILAIVTVCVTIVGTYFLLNAENYHWQWTSFCAAASTSLCVLSTCLSWVWLAAHELKWFVLALPKYL
jgi:hypothetical protein